MVDDQKAISFEQALSNLEQIIEQLENGEISLEKSLKLFEQGVKLAQTCTERLDDYEAKIEVLMKENGQFIRESYKQEEKK